MSDSQEVTLNAVVKPAAGKHARQWTEEYVEYVHQHEQGTLHFKLHKEEGEGRLALVERYSLDEDHLTVLVSANQQTFAEDSVLSEPPTLFIDNAAAGHSNR
ncbi:hypothetical protein DOTSEDRAFT_21209 [Dothistroma septosporum NZE10]|uniref:ABM domain-containing protein n=1 Tax=Dothistroma septosporum (strain NZE10 / CBS 128990) TaxID=675120 RepID=N1PVM2_DOTSN|nr:hypothetical protein DOTSEDRAFT_21209 [Dothistroma septosporum NZE10]